MSLMWCNLGFHWHWDFLPFQVYITSNEISPGCLLKQISFKPKVSKYLIFFFILN